MKNVIENIKRRGTIQMPKKQTKIVEYPCPTCGTYSKPFMHNSKGYALMLCPKCKTQFKTSTIVSANFRKFCSKIAKKPNRSPYYYTSSEKKIKKILDKAKYIEGIHYFHNVRVKDTTRKNKRGGPIYYWLDFYIPEEKLVISVSPAIWHKMWSREESDRKKKRFLESLGLIVIEVDEKSSPEIKRYLKWSVE